ncbi:hypothetical protein BU26DRAFT_177241 [Trematosphaeria pertusa]|uniref:Uncharacterized protein n=1 Tax=Trematosphaeria pertusa TaxID=390896 RepID=A0A6A6HT70_9PLEO|nr:uncharacterized protein BU26DRAFT_177241 [Trematosphaeria pertusa]KAF2241384.1 hypothetical protein BU26DRAFT_177241 [Trematosphaeria pertusa]
MLLCGWIGLVRRLRSAVREASRSRGATRGGSGMRTSARCEEPISNRPACRSCPPARQHAIDALHDRIHGLARQASLDHVGTGVDQLAGHMQAFRHDVAASTTALDDFRDETRQNATAREQADTRTQLCPEEGVACVRVTDSLDRKCSASSDRTSSTTRPPIRLPGLSSHGAPRRSRHPNRALPPPPPPDGGAPHPRPDHEPPRRHGRAGAPGARGICKGGGYQHVG